MKKKALLSSVLVIALCLCLIAGSTFALFTDSTEFNIAVTSGDVEILSTAEVVQRWSAEGPVEKHSDKYLKDENGSYYKHIKRDDTFTNGGTADVDKNTGTLVIDKITPGDKVDVRINTQNLGNVAFRYRYIVSVLNDKGLATGMVLTTHSGEEYEAVKSFISEWFDVVEAGATVPSKDFSLELPVYAGNEYQSEKTAQEDGRPAGDISVEYKITVEAVQGNAVTTEELTTVEMYPVASAVADAIMNGGYLNGGGVDMPGFDSSIDVVGAVGGFENMTLNGDKISVGFPRAVVSVYDQDGLDQGALILGKDAVVNVSKASTSGVSVLFRASEITLEKGSLINVTGDNAKGIFFTNVAGDTVDLYLEDTGLITVNGQNSYGIYVDDSASFTLNIHVPNNAARAYYEAMLFGPVGNGSSVNWIVAE